jgi:hypothetical protein
MCLNTFDILDDEGAAEQPREDAGALLRGVGVAHEADLDAGARHVPAAYPHFVFKSILTNDFHRFMQTSREPRAWGVLVG